jgi:sigma-B regulation protein RsbU (phosphoserine phosphatase)
VIRAVHLERMKMALNVVRLSDGEIAMSSAGMPPAYIYRHASGQVEELLLPGVPLGGIADSEYELAVAEHGFGDALVLISDGLPEWRNAAGELLGYEAVRLCIAEHGGRPAAEILGALLALGEEWAGRRDPDDDVTVIVLKKV